MKDNRLYIGSTDDLNKRMKEHLEGKVFSTMYRRPLELIYYEAYQIERVARNREKKLKYFGKVYQELKKRLELKGAG
jgi:predicted GIY-YIG superfamily endonuclease